MDNWEKSASAELAAAFDAEHRALPLHKTATERAVCRKYSVLVRTAPAPYVLDFARQLFFEYDYRWQAYELIAGHPPAFYSLDESKLEEFGRGIDSWWSTDSFARTLSGPAWRDGLVQDGLFTRWAQSADLWWRRASLVSTVAFNVRSHGGKGDALRTLAICRLLASDHTDMVVKGLSWALRELVYFDRQAVEGFLQEFQSVLAGRVRREVGSKLRTGLKYKRRIITTI